MGYRSKAFDDATTDSYQDSQKIKVLDWTNKLLMINNNHGSNDVTFQIYGVADDRDETDSSHVLLTATNLSAGDSERYYTKLPWDKLYFKVKNKTPGSNASAVIWINGSR